MYDWILRNISDAPLAVVAVLLFYFSSSLRELKKSVKDIQSNMVPKDDFKELGKEVERIKEEQVWKDVFDEIIKAIKDRLAKIETKVFNGGG